jgi:hypothetical protein
MKVFIISANTPHLPVITEIPKDPSFGYGRNLLYLEKKSEALKKQVFSFVVIFRSVLF